MYCKKCGEKLNKNWKYCPKCKNILNSKTIEMNEEKIIESKRKEENNSIICIIIFFIGLVGLFTTKLKGIFFLTSLISIVTGFIKCPNSRFIKILFWVFFISIIILLVYLILIIIACSNAWNDCIHSSAGY